MVRCMCCITEMPQIPAKMGRGSALRNSDTNNILCNRAQVLAVSRSSRIWPLLAAKMILTFWPTSRSSGEMCFLPAYSVPLSALNFVRLLTLRAPRCPLLSSRTTMVSWALRLMPAMRPFAIRVTRKGESGASTVSGTSTVPLPCPRAAAVIETANSRIVRSRLIGLFLVSPVARRATPARTAHIPCAQYTADGKGLWAIRCNRTWAKPGAQAFCRMMIGFRNKVTREKRMKIFLAVTVPLTIALVLAAADPVCGVTYVGHEKVSAALSKGGPLVSAPDLLVSGSFRDKAGQVEVHDKETDVIYVVDGTATFVTGGRMVGGKVTKPGQLMGSDIIGGQTHNLSRGVGIVVPATTPPWF